MDEPDVRDGVPPSRQGTIHTGASWMWLARYSAALSSRINRSRLMPGAGSPARYRAATCSSQARLYKAPTVSLIAGSLMTRNRQRCIFPPLGARTPASRILRINSLGTGSGFNRRIERVVLMISNRSAVWGVRQAWRPRWRAIKSAEVVEWDRLSQGSFGVLELPGLDRCRGGSPGR